ncbi:MULTISPECIES: exo-alpha-sialidase [unclassified Oceanispirochaeta]|uniref:sialidase family protein n=1 Tax=unclassified Oceanispirochaeta TaxID=2635722 RepID=UPI0013144377|nr:MULTISPECIES: sialidase family protein [unclassified Oceanispirochaeta]MBF9018809.1 exo-alpha-sialidase [Oceanispirochaeta sp. M2]NPD75278.1 exo-alpha-sialidase [Oceanispirochaeta sp. M1]
MKKTILAKTKLHEIVSWAISLLMITVGGILICIPIVFWDFLVYEQFKPTVRPYYPVFYGAIAVGGFIIVLLGILGFVKKKDIKESRGNFLSNYIIPLFAIVVGVGALVGALDLYNTTEYLAADKLYLMILMAPILGALLLLLLVPAGISIIVKALRKKAISGASRRAVASALVLVLMGAVIGAVLTLPPDATAKPYPEDSPFRTVLYAQGEAGYNTFKIPTMITVPNGTILSFAEARTEHKDDWSKTDVVLRKSYDLGSTWTPLEVLMEEGNLIIGNACPVVDRKTGFIWLIFCKQNDTAWKMHSEDNGETWSEPIEITQDVKLPNWTWYATGPSNGIQLKDGTLIIPADHIVDRKMQGHVIFSKDGGSTWELGGTIPTGEEGTLVELDNGDLYINIRPVKPGHRVTAISEDQGLTWLDYTYDKALPDPACEGSLIKIEKPEGSLYLFTNPADSLHREMMTVRLSDDECKTWSKSKILYEGMASYSALSLIDAENDIIGCIFEKGANYYAEEIVFMRFPLSFLDE